MFKKLLAYYLPFDEEMGFQLLWIWQNAKVYAYRNAIASVACTGIAIGANIYRIPIAGTVAFSCGVVATFFATVFTAAVLDPRNR